MQYHWGQTVVKMETGHLERCTPKTKNSVTLTAVGWNNNRAIYKPLNSLSSEPKRFVHR